MRASFFPGYTNIFESLRSLKTVFDFNTEHRNVVSLTLDLLKLKEVYRRTLGQIIDLNEEAFHLRSRKCPNALVSLKIPLRFELQA